eukprot:CCRYP_004201-RA/>CCRYP_004201-RA protein AED:0.20 eAED:0.20 QI:0/0.5/0/1/0/0/3/0/59
MGSDEACAIGSEGNDKQTPAGGGLGQNNSDCNDAGPIEAPAGQENSPAPPFGCGVARKK